MKAGRRYFVTGKVQGVGFRRFVQKQATLLNLTGWTRNVIDGRVEVCALGPEEDHAQFYEKLKKGPAFSVVESVEVHDCELETRTDFVIFPDGDPR